MLETLISTPLLLYGGVFVLGALIGSFVNVVILRLPPLLEYDWRCQCHDLLQNESEPGERPLGIAVSRSMCPHCGHGITALENIPVLSFLVLRGRCSACGERISLRYPLVELTTALLFLATLWHFGPTAQGLLALPLTAVLVALTGIDADTQLLPDNMTLPLLWAGILVNYFGVYTDLGSSVLGAIAGYLILWSIYHLFRLMTGKEGMGYGDFKLLAAMGAWMGWQFLPLIVLLSSVVGAVVGLVLMGTGRLNRDKPMPFGPFIAAAGWIALIWGERIMAYYTRSSGFG
ncbi:prepilin peptidase [Elongatibacter sediminis]|uniref:Prepilin leader peptidase/N-methyltransferase n=1 Tax=Elongatibacter sediminis TaxID=3119006 RepID=A0AAW9RL63_9GAMM